jgi:predicted TIM-barrel fold metal-dependent hydrolase
MGPPSHGGAATVLRRCGVAFAAIGTDHSTARPDPAELRASLGHPVVDADGHILEFLPAALPFLREALGPQAFDRWRDRPLAGRLGGPSAADAARTRVPRGGWWSSPMWRPRDLAASLAPRLLRERIGEMGIDFAVLYPTHALGAAGFADDEIRRGVCRGFNDYLADAFAPCADRLAVAGIVPIDTPDEAIAELEHCAAIGLRVVTIPHAVLRRTESPTPSPWLYPGQSHWIDSFGLDSLYDYDPVWQRCADLGFAVTIHGGAGIPPIGWYTSPTSFVANHIGSFMSMNYPVCKSLLLGGVTRRFPRLPFAFQEGGVWWAAGLLADTVEHWEKRNADTIRTIYDPALLDLDALERLVREHAPELVDAAGAGSFRDALRDSLISAPPAGSLDEWAAIDVRSEADIVERFAPSFFFGCEADDRLVAAAFSPANPCGAELRVMLGSDISHFDTPDFDDVLPAAWSLVESGVLTPEQFRRFVCDNAVDCFTRQNPAFFDGTPLAEGQPKAGVPG